MQFDQRTLEVVLMIVNLLSFAVMVILWRINTSERGPEFWALAALMATVGFFSMVFFPIIGNYAIFLNNGFTLMTYLFILEGILRFRGFGDERKRYPMLFASVVFFLGMSFLLRNNPAFRYLFYDSVTIVLLGLALYFMLYRTTKMETLAHLVASGAFILLILCFARRWYLAYSGAIEFVQNGSTQHPFQSILFLIGIPWTIGWTYGLVVALIYKNQNKLLSLAAQDELTSLNNRRSLSYKINSLISANKFADKLRGGKFLICLIDLNGFKNINDSFGHSFGDQILVRIAEMIKSSIREEDLAIRYGGDEFVIVMPGHGIEKYEMMKERIRDAVEQKFILNNCQVIIRASIGFAAYPDDGANNDELLYTADYRMYQEKQNRQLYSQVIPKILQA